MHVLGGVWGGAAGDRLYSVPGPLEDGQAVHKTFRARGHRTQGRGICFGLVTLYGWAGLGIRLGGFEQITRKYNCTYWAHFPVHLPIGTLTIVV